MSPKSSVKPPSEVQFIPFPPFGLKWYTSPPHYYQNHYQYYQTLLHQNQNQSSTSPPNLDLTPPPPPVCTAYAIAGGGGAAKTGFKNCVHLVLTISKPPHPQDFHGGSPQSQERTVEIDTGSGCAIDVALHQSGGVLWVLVAIGNGFSLYFVPLVVDGDDGEELEFTRPDTPREGVVNGDEGEEGEEGEGGGKESVLMAEGTFDETVTCESVSFNPDGNVFAAGYENGKICVFTLDYKSSSHDNDGNDDDGDGTNPSNNPNNDDSDDGYDKLIVTKYAEFHQPDHSHIKAVGTLTFHPTDPTILASCARDGTARIWNLQTQTCTDVLRCKIYDADRPPPSDPKITDPKPGQLVVRGVAFGDPQGRFLYTVQSGKKGPAYLSGWNLVVPPSPPQGGGPEGGPPTTPNGNPAMEPPPTPVYREVMRNRVSKYPVCAMSLSDDFSTLVLGDTDGTVYLYSTRDNALTPLKTWINAHETPVTCIAARPYAPTSNGDLPGEEVTGVNVDVMTASFDNRVLFLTTQKRSRFYVPPERPKRGLVFQVVRLGTVAAAALVAMASYDVCGGEVMEMAGSGSLDMGKMKECLVDTVLWAPEERVGVSVLPV